MPVKVNDRGLKKLVKELEYLETHHVRIGVLSGPARGGRVDAGAAKKSPGKAAQPRVALTVAEVFAMHELGLGHNPKRSSIVWVGENKTEELRKVLAQVFNLVISHGMSAKDALYLVGEKAQSLVKARIVSGIAPPLSPKYLKRKSKSGGKAKPLIWTGQLLNSVRYQVQKKL